MPQIKYYYNPKTLRYERTRLSVFKILLAFIGYLSCGVLFFVGLVILQNYIVQTPLEKSLRAENSALSYHKVVLSQKLSEANNQLDSLEAKDNQLYEDLFETKRQPEVLKEDNKEEILMAGLADFNGWAATLDEKFKTLSERAKNSSYSFRESASVHKEDLEMLKAVPSGQPIENFDVSRLVSGYGTRINPFHKGNYHHDGVDISASRRSKVLAGGNGTVILVKRSDLLAGFGNYIEIDHGFGYITRYAHLEEIIVRNGQKITVGQAIGTVGTSGGTIAPHLHYEVIRDGKNLDPVNFMLEGFNSLQYHNLLEVSKKVNQSLD
jgi:murein DD-endopeptidase MepM/ murein hydrolase activator NlpD